MRKTNILTLYGILLILAALCSAAAQQTLRFDAALVGASIVSIKDIQRTMCINKNDALQQRDALVMLINEALEREVAHKFGLLPTAAEVAALNKHINTTTKAPDILQEIKECFGADIDGYNKTYIEPKILNVKLHAYHSNDTIIQAAPRAAINRAYGMVTMGKTTFQQVAKSLGLHFYYDTLLIAGIKDTAPKGAVVSEENSLGKIASALKAGELYGRIIESNIQYTIMALVERNNMRAVIACIIADKANYDTWFESQAKSVNILIYAHDMATAIKNQYPDLWWSKTIVNGSD